MERLGCVGCLHLHDEIYELDPRGEHFIYLFCFMRVWPFLFFNVFCCRVCHFLLLQWPVSRFSLLSAPAARVYMELFWAHMVTGEQSAYHTVSNGYGREPHAQNSGRIEVKRLNKSWGTIKVFGSLASANITHHFHLILLFWDACDDTANRIVKVKRISGQCVCDKHPLVARIFNLIWNFCFGRSVGAWPFASRPNQRKNAFIAWLLRRLQ